MTEQPASPSPRPYEEFHRTGADGQTPAAEITSAVPGTDDRVAEVAEDPPERTVEQPGPAEHFPEPSPRAEVPNGVDASGGIDASGGGDTGVPEVDALLSVLDDLDVLPIEDHAQVFAEAHQRLHETLLSADEE